MANIRRTRWAQWTRQARWLWRVGLLLPVLALSACVASSAPAAPRALWIVGAGVVANPDSYSQPCGASQTFRYTATLTANSGNIGGTVHYRWRIGYSTAEGDLIFAPGEMSHDISRTVTVTVQPDAEPLLLSTIQTTTPNVLASPELAIRLPCTAPLQVASVDLTVSPSSAGCGPQTFGFAAILAGPEGNSGGTVHFTWHFLDGSSRPGSVRFAPGQINVTIAAATTYYVLPGALPASRAPKGAQAASTPLPTPIRPTPTPRPTPRPTATRVARPTPTLTAGPLGTPVVGGEIGAWLSVDSPNAVQSDTVVPEVDC